MFINENYQFPSELHDSADNSQLAEHIDPIIRAVNLYQLNHQQADLSKEQSSSQNNEMNQYLESSVQSDGFLQMLRHQEKGSILVNAVRQEESKEREAVLADKKNVELILVETQSARETIVFTNITSNKIRLKFNQCPFQLKNNQMLGFLLAQQLEIVIEPWDRTELTFAIEPQASTFGDIIENIVVTSEFIDKKQAIAPITVRFHIKYASPKITLKYEGGSNVLALRQGKIAVASIRANKLGEYELGIVLGEGIQKMELVVESRGKIVTSSQSLTLYRGEVQKLKLRHRGRSMSSKERGGVILKAENTQICYVVGVELIA